MEKRSIEFVLVEMPVESRGVSVSIDLAKLSDDLFRQVVTHGIKQKVADAASNAVANVWLAEKGKDAPKPSRDQMAAFAESRKQEVQQETVALMQKAVDALYEGKWAIREGTGTVTKWTDEQAEALTNAKADLVSVMQRAATASGLKHSFENYVSLGDAVAKYFTKSGKKFVWKDEAVMAWIVGQQAAGKRDYLAEAKDAIAARNALLDSVDLSAMLGDL